MKFEARWGRNGYNKAPAIGNALVPQELLAEYQAVAPTLKAHGLDTGFAPVQRTKLLLHEFPDDPNLIAVRRFQKLFSWHQQIANIEERLPTVHGREQVRLAQSLRLLRDKVVDHQVMGEVTANPSILQGVR